MKHVVIPRGRLAGDADWQVTTTNSVGVLYYVFQRAMACRTHQPLLSTVRSAHHARLQPSAFRPIRFRTNSTVSQAQETLSWPEYLAIRKGKRKWEMVCVL